MERPSVELPKTYDHREVEPRWYGFWKERGYFHADARDRSRPAFCIVLPPPNVTGSLHLGHALTATLQDVLCRWKRMSGFNVLWLPGTDHAGIATQMVVEKEIQRTEKKSRHDLGREKFLERVWVWMIPPYSRFHFHTSSTKRSRPSSTREVPCLRRKASTTFCVAMPAWSLPGRNRVSLPRMR